MAVKRNVVVAKKVTRYYVNGRGFNSELDAYVQIAKRYVNEQFWKSRDLTRDSVPNIFVAESAWYGARYPKRPECNCSFCRSVKLPGMPSERGCFISRLADYRQIAREIIDGTREADGTPKAERRALPERTEVPA